MKIQEVRESSDPGHPHVTSVQGYRAALVQRAEEWERVMSATYWPQSRTLDCKCLQGSLPQFSSENSSGSTTVQSGLATEPLLSSSM